MLCAVGYTRLPAMTWHVGPGKQYLVPSAVAALAANGDTVLIDAGVYTGDVCSWRANNLLIRGNGGRVKLAAGGKSSEQKAIWVIKGNNTTVENIEFSDCIVPDHNGAGIRQEGANLTVRNCAFRRNEMGILAGNNLLSTIIVEYTEFERSGYGDGFSHNIYINHIYRFVFRYNYSHHALIGHECKSRAHRNEILYNRLSNEDGRASREIDLPNGGFSVVLGNVIHQGVNAENSNIIGYGLEGVSDSLNNELYVVNNTIVNERPAGAFVQTQSGTSKVMIRNNVFVGAGSVFSGAATTLDSADNIRASTPAAAGLADAAGYDYRLTAMSPAVSSARPAGTAGVFSLNPTEEYVHPAGKTTIQPVGAVFSAGAYQFQQTSGIVENGGVPECTVECRNGTIFVEAAGHILCEIWNLQGRLLASATANGEARIPLPDKQAVFVRVHSPGAIHRRFLLPD